MMTHDAIKETLGACKNWIGYVNVVITESNHVLSSNPTETCYYVHI